LPIGQVFQYNERNSLIHRLDPRVKLIWLVICSYLGIITETYNFIGLYCLIAYFGTLLAIYALSKPSWRIVKDHLSLICFLMIAYGLFMSLWPWPDPKFPLIALIPPQGAWPLEGGLFFSVKGMFYGITRAIKFNGALLAGFVLITTTPANKILRGLEKIRLPYKICFMMSVAIRFIPMFLDEMITILDAQKARGLDIKIKRPDGFLRATHIALTPMIINSLRKANILSLAIECRAFDPNKKRTDTTKLHTERLDYAFIAFFIGFAIVLTTVLLFNNTIWSAADPFFMSGKTPFLD